ncbi:MAG: PD40 domain-containing protein [Bacteroidia bacterium]|nr:PD40 domain-containing protein [Bacteroidia bacterium]
MKNKIVRVVLILSAFFISSGVIKAGGVSEHARARAAEKLFLAKQYDKASPLYAQLVSSNPKNFKYNYYYGICLLITGKDKRQCLPYLEMALQNPKTPEDIYYYIGRALHYTYRFDEAMRSFVEFNGIIGARNAPRWGTPQLMEMCNHAKQFLDTTKLAAISERTESAAYDFYNKYAFNNPNGKLLSMPDEMIQASKSEKEERPTIFLSANGRVMYYSSLNPETNSRDIFRVEKDIDGNWTAPVAIDRMVNGPQDELFPTCNSDGRILYFSSRGHSSTGGFDIFKTYYNTVSKTWTKPENMGSPYNSPDDDFCFVASTQEQTAYFTSQRETAPGTFTVYKVPYSNTEELPIAINGKFNCVGQPGLKKIHLVVTRDGEQNIVSDVMTDSINGAYAIELPGPGTYAFRIEADGFNPHTEEIRFGEFSDRIYVQDIFLSRSVNGMEDMAIANRRLTESGLIDETLMANTDEEETSTTGVKFSEAEIAAMKVSGYTPEMIAEARKNNPTGPLDMNSMNPDNTGIHNSEMSVNLQGIVFKVQIGAFRKHNREVVLQRLEKKTDKSMLSSYDDLTWLRFFMGGEVQYKSAKNLRETLKQAGFSDAFVVAFRNNKPMKLQEAINLTGKGNVNN